MEDDDLPDTRVFVSGLPVNLTSDQLGAHFAGRYQVTDAVIVPGRRIGFVGFRNYTLAKSAVKYFDKTYIRMSKISVQIAKQVDISHDGSQPAPVSKRSAAKSLRNEGSGPQTSTEDVPGVGTTSQTAKTSFTPYAPVTTASNPNKRKREVQDGEKKEQLQEYTNTMQQASKSKIWTNGEPSPVTETVSENNATSTSVAPELEEKTAEKSDKKKSKKPRRSDAGNESPADDRENASTSSKRKKSEAAASIGFANAGVENSSNLRNADSVKETHKSKRKDMSGRLEPEEQVLKKTHQNDDVITSEEKKKEKKKSKDKGKDKQDAKGGVESFDDDAFGPSKHLADLDQQSAAKSDNDWMRSKTSRLLDLTEPDDESYSLKNNQDLTDPHSSSSDEDDDPADSAGGPGASSAPAAELATGKLATTNGRLFVRNLPYEAVEADVERFFSKLGKLGEVHIVRDKKSSGSKGFAYVQYVTPDIAAKALHDLDGKAFQGRLLHIMPASDKKSQKLNEFDLAKLPMKKQKELRRKADAAATSFSWNSMYMNPDAVMSSVADRLGVTKAELLDPTSSHAAVKQAHAETHVIQETKAYFSSQGINLDAFQQKGRDPRVLLVKNFRFGVTVEELKSLFEPYGQIVRLLLPPTGTIAIIQYAQAGEASQALNHLSYRNLKGSVLFLERAPQGLFDASLAESNVKSKEAVSQSRTTFQNPAEETADLASSTLFVRNLNFSTTTARLIDIFKPLTGYLSARVKTKTDPRRPGEILSTGFGFVEFRTKKEAQAALEAMNGYKLDNHELIVRVSHKATDAAEEKRREDAAKKLAARRTKIIIKNLPFEASKKDIRSLFGAYGQLRSVRVPKKFDRSTRGFAFADFVTAKEAENAMEALANTHLLGRRLVLEFASGDAVDPEEELRAIEKKVGQQREMIHVNKITGSARRKFNVDARDDGDAE